MAYYKRFIEPASAEVTAKIKEAEKGGAIPPKSALVGTIAHKYNSVNTESRLSISETDDTGYMAAIMQAAEQEEQQRTEAAKAAAQAARQARAKQRVADKAAKAGNRAAAAVAAEDGANRTQAENLAASDLIGAVTAEQDAGSEAGISYGGFSEAFKEANASASAEELLGKYEEASRVLAESGTAMVSVGNGKYTQKSYSHAFSNKEELNLNAAENLPELVENAVLTHMEEAKHGDVNATNVFTFFAAGHDGKNTVPVKLKVKEYSVKNQNIPENIAEYMRENGMMTDYDSVYDSVVLELDEIENDEASSSAAAGFTAHDPSTSSTINVADLLRLVNGDARKYIPQLFGVDGEEVSRYNEDVTEVRENAGEDQLYGASGEGVREGRSGAEDYSKQPSGRSIGRGDVLSSGVLLLSEESKRIIEERGAVYVEVHETTDDRAAFSDALDAARNADTRNGWAVTPKSVKDLSAQGMRSFMIDGNLAGFALTSEGDIEGYYIHPNAQVGISDSLIPQAIALGGNRLDCYGAGLVRIYEKYGFVPVATVEFNEEFANPGWDESKGRPDVVIMIHNGDDADTVVKRMSEGGYHHYTTEEISALRHYDKDGYFLIICDINLGTNTLFLGIHRKV